VVIVYWTPATGPNPLNPTQTVAGSVFGSTSYTYYEGHGMLHAVYFSRSGGAGGWEVSYRNKYVGSDTLQLERRKKDDGVAFVPSVDGQPYATLAAFALNIVSLAEPVTVGNNNRIKGQVKLILINL
jgi:hypothetical protein